MANLKSTDKLKLEKLLEMGGGFVLDFSDNTFHEFFIGVVDIDIYNDKYTTYGTSKGKRLRAFWQLERDKVVGQVLSEMIEHWRTLKLLAGIEITSIEESLGKECQKIADRLVGKTTPTNAPESEKNENDFLQQVFEEIKLDGLGLESGLVTVLEQRIQEIQKGLKSKSSLSVLFLCGSSLEGVLLGVASQNPRDFNQASSSPKDRGTGDVKQFSQWTLSDLINVAHQTDFIGLDVKKFSHSLREFRNYIHPHQQWASGFDPDGHTAEISWQVFKAAIHDINVKMKILELKS